MSLDLMNTYNCLGSDSKYSGITIFPRKQISEREKVKMQENQGTADSMAGTSSSSEEGYNFHSHQKRKEIAFFDKFKKKSRFESKSTDGPHNHAGPGSNIRRTQIGKVIYPRNQNEKTDTGKVVTAPQDDMSTDSEMTETTEGIRKMTIEEMEEYRRRQMALSQHRDDGDSDLDSVSKGIPQGDSTLGMEEESMSLLKPQQAAPSMAVDGNQQSMPSSSLAKPIPAEPSMAVDGNQQSMPSSSLAKPIPAEPSMAVDGNQQSMPSSSLAKPIQAEPSMGVDGNQHSMPSSSLAKPIPTEPSMAESQQSLHSSSLTKPIPGDQSGEFISNQQNSLSWSQNSASEPNQGASVASLPIFNMNQQSMPTSLVSQLSANQTSLVNSNLSPSMPSFQNPVPAEQSWPFNSNQQSLPFATPTSAAQSMILQQGHGIPISSFAHPTQAASLGQNAIFYQQMLQHMQYMYRWQMSNVQVQTDPPVLVSTETQTDESSFTSHFQPVDTPMMQQTQHVSMTSQQMTCQPVNPNMQQAVVHRSTSLVQRSSSYEMQQSGDTEMTAAASALPHIPSTDNSAIFVPRTWGNDFGRSSLFNRFLATLVSQIGVTVFSPVLQRSKQPIVRDDESGVFKLHPDELKIARLNHHEPSVDWFFQHRSLYPYMHQLPNVKSIISYLSVGEDKGLIEAAKDFKQSLFGRAKLIYINVAIPEDFGDTQGEAEALDNATAADVVFSLGHHIFYHFQNKYKALYEAQPRHILYLPPLADMFITTDVQPTDGKQQVLSVCSVKCEADFHRYTLGAVAMGKLVNAYYHAYERLPVWSVIGVDAKLLVKFEEFLRAKANSRQLRINVYPSNSLKDFRRSLLQSVLFIAPDKTDSFSFTAYLAMQAGIPVLVPSCSGIVTFLERVFEYKDHASFCSVETGLHDFSLDKDGERWKDTMISRVNPQRRDIAFKRAQELKKDLKSCQSLQQSHENFLRELL